MLNGKLLHFTIEIMDNGFASTAMFCGPEPEKMVFTHADDLVAYVAKTFRVVPLIDK